MNTQIYKVGKTYEVPCARIKHDVLDKEGFLVNRLYVFDENEWVPIMGEKHCDTHIIGFQWEHYHIDWRFVSTSRFRKRMFARTSKNYVLAEVITTQHIYETKTMPLRMIRKMPEYPNPIRFTEALETHYANATAKKYRCPHQGVDLSSIAPNDKGQIVCPLHGLRFCKNSLKLIKTLP